MGLFDGFEAGWNSFKNKELKQATQWVTENTGLDNKVVNYVKSDPQKATKAINKPFDTALNQLFKLSKGKANVGLLDDKTTEIVTEPLGNNGPIIKAIEQGVEESSQPIWERESTVKIIGEDGAKELENTLNPAAWIDNATDIIPDIIPQQAPDTVKKYLPVAALGAAVLLVVSALK